MTLKTPSQEGIALFFPEPPKLSGEDLGVKFRQGGVEYFLEAARVIAITPPLKVSPMPGQPGRGVTFWRGLALEVRGNAAMSAAGFVQIRGKRGSYLLASEIVPAALSRSQIGEGITLFPEDE